MISCPVETASESSPREDSAGFPKRLTKPNCYQKRSCKRICIYGWNECLDYCWVFFWATHVDFVMLLGSGRLVPFTVCDQSKRTHLLSDLHWLPHGLHNTALLQQMPSGSATPSHKAISVPVLITTIVERATTLHQSRGVPLSLQEAPENSSPLRTFSLITPLSPNLLYPLPVLFFFYWFVNSSTTTSFPRY